MSALLWPGDHRAGDLMGDAALVRAMVAVESAWLAALIDTGIASPAAADDLQGLVDESDLPALTVAAEDGGNPVIPLVALLRDRVAPRTPDAATWLHRGMTSQDVLDTALMLCARDAIDAIGAELSSQVCALQALIEGYSGRPMLARTLTQPAVPSTFEAKLVAWTQGLLDASDDLRALSFPAQFGGAAGTRSGATTLAAGAGISEPAKSAVDLAARAADRLHLAERQPWHTARAPITRIGSALAGCCSAWGRIANDVLTLNRAEIGELSERAVAGRGGSSAMPHKSNPVLSVLIRRAALSAPAYASLLHLAAADMHDERAAGAWHVEWQPLQLLARHTVVAGGQTTELLTGLQVDVGRMQANLEAQRAAVDAESDALAKLPFPGSRR